MSNENAAPHHGPTAAGTDESNDGHTAPDSAWDNARRLEQMRQAGELDAYTGQYVAMVDGKIVGHDRDWYPLLERFGDDPGHALTFVGTIPVPPPIAEIDDDGVAALMDMGRLMQMYNNGELGEYVGQHVAMVDGKIVGSGKNPSDLLERMSRELAVPKHRVALWSCSDTALIG